MSYDCRLSGYLDHYGSPLVLSILPLNDDQIRAIIDVVRYEIACEESNEEILCQSCAALADIAGGETFESRSIRNIDCILRHGGMDAVLLSMAKHPYNAKMQEAALQALWRFARNPESREFIALHSVGKIVCAMRMHFDILRVQELACSALLNLSAESKVSTLVAEHALEDILILIRTEHDRTSILELAGAVLRNLAQNPFNGKAIMKLGFCDIIGRFRDCLGKCRFQVIAMGVFSNLSLHDDNDRLIALQGIDLILSSMKHHVESRDVQKEALKCIWNLTFNKENKRSFPEGGLNLILMLMRRYIDDSELQASSCAVLANLLDFGEEGMCECFWRIHKYMRDLRDSCIRAMLNMEKDDAVVEEGFRVLLLLEVGQFGPIFVDGDCQPQLLLRLAETRARRAGPKDRARASLFAQACDNGHTAMMRKLLNRTRPAAIELASNSESSYRVTAMAASYLAIIAKCSVEQSDVCASRSALLSDAQSLAHCRHVQETWSNVYAQIEQVGLRWDDEKSGICDDGHASPALCTVHRRSLVAAPIGKSTVGSGHLDKDQGTRRLVHSAQAVNVKCSPRIGNVKKSSSSIRNVGPIAIERNSLSPRTSERTLSRQIAGSERSKATRINRRAENRQHSANTCCASVQTLALNACDPPYTSPLPEFVDQGWCISDISDLSDSEPGMHDTVCAVYDDECCDVTALPAAIGHVPSFPPVQAHRGDIEGISGSVLLGQKHDYRSQKAHSQTNMKSSELTHRIQESDEDVVHHDCHNSKQVCREKEGRVQRRYHQIHDAGFGQIYANHQWIGGRSNENMLEKNIDKTPVWTMEKCRGFDFGLNDQQENMFEGNKSTLESSKAAPLSLVRVDEALQFDGNCQVVKEYSEGLVLEGQSAKCENPDLAGDKDESSRDACQNIVQVVLT